jgi:hypothetical protein
MTACAGVSGVLAYPEQAAAEVSSTKTTKAPTLRPTRTLHVLAEIVDQAGDRIPANDIVNWKCRQEMRADRPTDWKQVTYTQDRSTPEATQTRVEVRGLDESLPCVRIQPILRNSFFPYRPDPVAEQVCLDQDRTTITLKAIRRQVALWVSARTIPSLDKSNIRFEGQEPASVSCDARTCVVEVERQEQRERYEVELRRRGVRSSRVLLTEEELLASRENPIQPREFKSEAWWLSLLGGGSFAPTGSARWTVGGGLTLDWTATELRPGLSLRLGAEIFVGQQVVHVDLDTLPGLVPTEETYQMVTTTLAARLGVAYELHPRLVLGATGVGRTGWQYFRQTGEERALPECGLDKGLGLEIDARVVLLEKRRFRLYGQALVGGQALWTKCSLTENSFSLFSRRQYAEKTTIGLLEAKAGIGFRF